MRTTAWNGNQWGGPRGRGDDTVYGNDVPIGRATVETATGEAGEADFTYATTYDWGYSKVVSGGGYAGGSIYHFSYGPYVFAYDGFYEKPTATVHGLTLMSNGDLWDMRTPKGGGCVTWTGLGRY